MTRPALSSPTRRSARLPLRAARPLHATWIVGGLVVLAAAALRFYALDASSLWSDEGNTWALVQRDFAAIAHDAAADIHPPGYYWLLKLWTWATGTHAWAMRAFSALCGVLVVVAVYFTARLAEPTPQPNSPDHHAPLHDTPWFPHLAPWLAAWIVAWNPLQIYYSQEARMYMPLALAGAGLFAALLGYTRAEHARARNTFDFRVAPPNLRIWAAAFWAWGALGLWLHYSFPIVLTGAGLFYLWHWGRLSTLQRTPDWKAMARFAMLAAAIVAPFLPWLPTALRQILTWPQGNRAVSLAQGLELTLATLVHGPTLSGPLLSTLPGYSVWLGLAGILPLVGLWARSRVHLHTPRVNPALAILFWLGTPIAMMFGLGLFSDAFLKFLLVASPAWAIALAWSPLLGAAWLPVRWARLGQIGLSGLLAVGAVALAWFTLPAYYTNPTARDNYAGMARYVAAHGANSVAPLVILNAPGQGDVWGYYDPGIPVVGLPAQRPPDPPATEAALHQLAQTHDRIFALYWATAESDPHNLVESWLDRHAFPGLESWQGNVRFVDYSLPTQLTCRDLRDPPTFTQSDSGGIPNLALHYVCTQASTASPQPEYTAAAGDVLLIALGWESAAPQAATEDAQTEPQALAVTLQLLDARNQVVAQRDAPLPKPPARDPHGIPIPVGTPPGDYRLILALYDPATGSRLVTHTGDAVTLGTVTIARAPATPDPLIDAQHRRNQRLGPVTLLGYDLHRKDFAHAPTTPVQPGDLVQITLYWQAPAALPSDWPDDLHFDLTLGDAHLHAPLAGGDYPTGNWQPHEVVRARFELVYTGGDRRAHIQMADESTRLLPLP